MRTQNLIAPGMIRAVLGFILFVSVASYVQICLQVGNMASASEPTKLVPAPMPEENKHGIKVIAFDNFGTVYDFSQVPRDEVRDYVRQVRRAEWAPLDLPASWEDVKAFEDSAKGIAMLRNKYTVVTCANGPLGMLARMAKKNSISWDAIVPLELSRSYKPSQSAYKLIAETMGVAPHEVLIVTGNKGSPDLTVPLTLGMHSQRIRGDKNTPQTIIELAKQLGCRTSAIQQSKE